MEKGYNFLATIPSGACNATVTMEGQTKNNLALRWKNYNFNGGWIIRRSGNYTAGSNLFTYERPDDPREGGNGSAESIRFASQLTHGIDVFLVVKAKNPGVKFSYVLPPIRTPRAGPTKAASISNETREDADKMGGNADKVAGNADKVAGIVSRDDRDDRNVARGVANIMMQPYFRQAAAGKSDKPGWVYDLQNMMVKWKQELERQGRRINSLEGRVRVLESRMSK